MSANLRSSIISAGEERCIVSDLAGTTRDAIDIAVENEYGKFVLVDTAGLRRKSRVDDAVERYSMMRAQMAVERSDVCVIMIDGTVGFTEQDSKVAGMAHEAGKGCVIAVNKWDAVEKDEKYAFTLPQTFGAGFFLYVVCRHCFYFRKNGAAHRPFV